MSDIRFERDKARGDAVKGAWVSQTREEFEAKVAEAKKLPVVWERYDTEEGYYGLVWTLETDHQEVPEIVFETQEWPLKSLVGREVVRFLEESETYRSMNDIEFAKWAGL